MICSKPRSKRTSQVDQGVLCEIFNSIDQVLGQFVKAKVKFLDIGPHQTIDDAVAWLAKDPEVSLGDDEPSGVAVENLIGDRAALIAERDALLVGAR